MYLLALLGRCGYVSKRLGAMDSKTRMATKKQGPRARRDREFRPQGRSQSRLLSLFISWHLCRAR